MSEPFCEPKLICPRCGKQSAVITKDPSILECSLCDRQFKLCKDPYKTRISQMDDDEKALMEMIKGRINDVDRHRLDENKLLDEIENLIDEIEDIAMHSEMGDYELPNAD